MPGIRPFENIKKWVVPLALLCAASQKESTVTLNVLPFLISQLLLWYLAKKTRKTFCLPLPERHKNRSFSICKRALRETVLYSKKNRKCKTEFCYVCSKEVKFCLQKSKCGDMPSSLHLFPVETEGDWRRNDNFVSSCIRHHTLCWNMHYGSLFFFFTVRGCNSLQEVDILILSVYPLQRKSQSKLSVCRISGQLCYFLSGLWLLRPLNATDWLFW